MLDAPKRRPWYANAIAVGFGAILGAGTLLGLNGKTAHNDAAAAPAVTATSIGTQPHSQQSPEETQRWRERMESKLDALSEKVAHIEGRLEKR